METVAKRRAEAPEPLRDAAVEVLGLVKTYGARTAVAGLSFRIERGETFALLGPNGAGKTTTVEILEGYRRPDAGTVRVLDLDPIADGSRLKARIGVMLQEGGIYPAMTPGEALRLFSRFYPTPDDPQRLLRLVGLEEAATTRYRRLSGGQKQRLALALALVPRPELLFLDEPTTGLDPQARRATWEIIRGLRDEGITVLLTTHYLEEAERLADRVAIIDEGRLVALGTPSELVGSGGSIVKLTIGAPLAPAVVDELPSVRSVRTADEGVFLIETGDPPSLLVELTALLRDLEIPVRELRVGQGSLEDVFLELTGKEFRE